MIGHILLLFNHLSLFSVGPLTNESYRKSHETFPYLPVPTPPSFPLDFSQLLQATVAHPPSRPRIHRLGPVNIAREKIDEASKEEEEGWDLVDDDV